LLTVEGGTRHDGTRWFIRVSPWDHSEEKQLQAVTAVLAVMKMPSGVLVIRNARGWDLPGGHLEPRESPMEALKRESMEEAGLAVTVAVPIACLETDREPERTTYMLVYKVHGELHPHTPNSEVFERAFMPVAQFLKHYVAGSKELMKTLLEI